MKPLWAVTLVCLTFSVMAKQTEVSMVATDNQTPIGKIRFEDTPHGLLITPHLDSLRPGLHGFHVHQNHDCGDQGMAAGSHLDPAHTDKHLGPYQDGHLGALPVMAVDQAGKASVPVLAPRLKVDDLRGRSIVIHQGGDNYQDTPEPLGGGGARVACGLVNLPPDPEKPTASH